MTEPVLSWIVSVSAAIAGPAALGALGYAYRTWNDVHSKTERNAVANYGSDDPANPWPGTVKLTVDHEDRLQKIEDELDIDPPEPEGRWATRFAVADGGFTTLRGYARFRTRRICDRVARWFK